jgi:diguanylate cyclase (GGDEF)-like protein
MMDLDNFKQINDSYGHAMGDRVLVGFARHVMGRLRPYDQLFRYGGEEFLMCITDADVPVGLEIADRLRKEVALIPHEISAGQVRVTVSIGLAALDPDVPVEESIDRADKALYCAKLRGRDQTVAWDASMV